MDHKDSIPIPMKVVGVNPGDKFMVGSYQISVFQTMHRVTSQGYRVSRLKKKVSIVYLSREHDALGRADESPMK